MASILEIILAHKRDRELPARKQATPLAEMRRLAEQSPSPSRHFHRALQHADGRVALIAEIKRASPSKGELVRGDFNPLSIAKVYAENGASAISVLTDEQFFQGSLEYLRAVRHETALPVLRKDFIVDEYQVYEARAAGADAVLLIVAALDQAQLRDLHTLASSLGMTPLVEVHDEAETERALRIGAQVIGVNNRDLRTFTVDMHTTARCAALLNGEKHITLVSESGIFTAEDVARVSRMGARAVLVGESLITAPDIAAQVRALAGVRGPLMPHAQSRS
ncbi:MAG: indole-3-glycerol phosphate synthase TrpC [Thermoflexales bacterium]